MNIFILCTGRCGSVTFVEACKHISNFSAGHETRVRKIGDEHFDYPPNHIEADNRLSWFLGNLDRHYGDDAIYIHLKRDVTGTAKSFLKRYNTGIMKAYRNGILMEQQEAEDPLAVCIDYCETINNNIEHFVKDKTRHMVFNLENAKEDFRAFWDLIGAQGDLEAALSEWDTAHNASHEESAVSGKKSFAVEYTLSQEDLIKFNLFHIEQSPSLRRQALFGRLIAGFSFFLSPPALIYLLDGIQPPAFIYIISAMGGLGAFFAFPIINRSTVTRRMKKVLNEGDNGMILGKQIMTATAKGLLFEGQDDDGRLNWQAVTKTSQNQDYIYLYLNAMNAIIIPKKAFASADEQQAFLTFADSRIRK